MTPVMSQILGINDTGEFVASILEAIYKFEMLTSNQLANVKVSKNLAWIIFVSLQPRSIQ